MSSFLKENRYGLEDDPLTRKQSDRQRSDKLFLRCKSKIEANPEEYLDVLVSFLEIEELEAGEQLARSTFLKMDLTTLTPSIQEECIEYLGVHFDSSTVVEKLRPFLPYDLPLEILTSLWGESGRPGVFWQNFQALRSLEQKSPGVGKFLYKEFGIVHFGRYPEEMLLAQQAEVENQDLPYGTIIFPYSDKNGAFVDGKKAFQEAYTSLRGKALFRIVECSSVTGVARALLKLEKKYNATPEHEHRISFAFIGGHGTRESIQFGQPSRKVQPNLYLKDFQGKGVQRANRFFEDGACVGLISCSTGQEGGMAQELSKLIKGKVMGPDQDTNLDRINIAIGEEGGFDMSISYTRGHAVEYINGVRTQPTEEYAQAA